MTGDAPPRSSERRFDTLAALAIALAGIAAYANTFDGEFVWDDVSSVLLHEHVRDPGKILSLFTEDQHAFAGGQGNFYRPLVSVSFTVDYVLSSIGASDRDPAVVPYDLGTFFFHLSNALWHIAAALLLLLVMRRAGAPRAVYAVVPLLYVLHPLHTEAVAYISGRADSMSAVFIFAALACAIGPTPAKRPTFNLGLILLFFTCGLLSKESAFIFPALLGLAILLLPRSSEDSSPTQPLQRWLPLGAALIVLGAYAALRATVLNFDSDSTPPDSTIGERIVEAAQALALYAGLIAVPTGLHMERTLSDIPAYAAPAGFGFVAVLLLLFVLTWRSGRPRVALGLAWFLVAWLPISGVFPLNAPLAEHWMYVPLAGLLWACGELLYELTGTRAPAGARTPLAAAAGVVVALWAILLLGLTVDRNADWHSNESIYSATLRENPESTRVHFNLGVTYQDMLNNPPGARRHFEAVTRVYTKRKLDDPSIRDEYWNEELESHLSLGDILFDQGRLAEAFNHYRLLGSVLANDSTPANRYLFAMATLGMGRCHLSLGNTDAARQQFQLAVQVMPELQPQIQSLLSG